MRRHTARAAPLPDPDVVFRPTRRDIDSVTGERTSYALWDRHDWQPHGECWLWCGRDDVEVTWIGPVNSSGMHAALYSCRACLFQLDQRVLEANIRDDAGALPQAPPARSDRDRRRRIAAHHATP